MIILFYVSKNVELHCIVKKTMSANPSTRRTFTRWRSYDCRGTTESSKTYTLNLSGNWGLSRKLIYVTGNSLSIGKRFISTVGDTNS